MVKPKTPLNVLQKRLLWFFGFLAVIGLGGGYYFQSPLYGVIGLLSVGVLIGGIIRIVLDRRQLR